MTAALTVLLLTDLLYSNALLWEPRGIKEIKWFISKQCRDSGGVNGTCISLSACYPDLDFPHLSGWSKFISGEYDSCAYIKPNGKPFIGACCKHPPPIDPDDAIETSTDLSWSSTTPRITSPIVGDDPISIIMPVPKPQVPKPQIPQLPADWPPTHAPLPTHPPLITHPAFPTYHPFPPLTWFATKRTTTRPTSTTWKPWWIPIHEKQKILTTTTRTTTTTTTTTKSKPEVEIPTECGRRNNSFRVVGGQKAGYWPWIAGLLGRRGLFCGGSLLTNYHILTAAHCVTGLSPNDITVRLGDLDLSNATDSEHIDFKVSSITINPSYNSRTNHQDLAILRLKSKVTFNSDISPICLPRDNTRNYAGNNAIVIGWGATRARGPTSKVLMELSMRVWPVSECQTKFQTRFPNQIIPSNICAGDGGKDACSGDSGGPLMKHDNGIYTQIGVVSWGVGCGVYRYPGVYTRVTTFISWIKNNLN